MPERKPCACDPNHAHEWHRGIPYGPSLPQVSCQGGVGDGEDLAASGSLPASTGKPIYYRNASARGLDKAADRAGVNPDGVQRLSFHDLRHTAITHLIRSGADAAQVSRFAGHSKVSTTLDLYVGEFEKRRVNDSGARLGAIYVAAEDGASLRRAGRDLRE